MHREAMDFLTKTIGALDDLAGKMVLEIGSYDVNGSARALRPGGLLIITAAGPGREPRGDHGGPATGDMHFGVITPAALKKMLKPGWCEVRITGHKKHCDIYVTARRAAE